MEPTLDQTFLQESQQHTAPVPNFKDRVLLLIRSPRLAFQTLLQHHEGEQVNLIFYFVALSNVLDRALGKSAGDDMSLIAILAMSAFSAIFVALIGLPLSSWFLGVTGRWIGGKAYHKPIETVVAWANMPGILTLVAIMPMLLLMGREPFRSVPDIRGPLEIVVYYGYAASAVVLGIYSLILLVIGLSVVHHFSIGKAVANLVIAFLTIAVPILLIVLLIFGIN